MQCLWCRDEPRRAEPSADGTTWLVSKTIGPRGACAGYASALRAYNKRSKCTERTQRCAAVHVVMRYEYHQAQSCRGRILLPHCCALGCDGARMLHFELLRCKLSCGADRPAVARPCLGDHALAELLEQKFAVPQQ